MFQNNSTIILFALTFLLGLRHGIDWDHLAAISDITGTSDNRQKSFILGSLYVLGHASIIILLGLSAILVGLTLPSWFDQLMEPVVGLTLVLLGIWLIASILRHGKNFRFKSRWMLLFSIVSRFFTFLEQKLSHKHPHPHVSTLQKYNPKTAFIIGAIHGVGAETPTQVLLFITAAGAKGSLTGVLLLVTFVIGLMLSNSIITLTATLGFFQAKKNSWLLLLMGWITALFSLFIGILFLTGQTHLLPPLF